MDHQQSARVIVEIHGQLSDSERPTRSAWRNWRRSWTRRCGSRQRVPAGDTLKIAVLAALNVADEFFRACDADQDRRGRPPEPRNRAGTEWSISRSVWPTLTPGRTETRKPIWIKGSRRRLRRK
jgi:hypothetical protein